jgi:hypothetical protein
MAEDRSGTESGSLEETRKWLGRETAFEGVAAQKIGALSDGEE